MGAAGFPCSEAGGLVSGYHSEIADCVHSIGERLGQADLEPLTFTQAWDAFGVVVSALYRRRPKRPMPVESSPPPREPVTLQEAAPPTEPHVDSVCPHCGFESMTTRGTKLHISKMHKERRQFTRRELWERSHAANVPYPGDAEELASV